MIFNIIIDQDHITSLLYYSLTKKHALVLKYLIDVDFGNNMLLIDQKTYLAFFSSLIAPRYLRLSVHPRQ